MDENESFIRSMIENKAFNISAIINLINKRGKKSLKNKILDDKLTKIIKYVWMCFDSEKLRGIQPRLFHPILLGRRSFEVIHTDHVGPFIIITMGN